jgi:kynureninase
VTEGPPANPLAAHYTRFAVADRLLLTGHSHQAWPDVAFDGVVEAFDDAARHVDDKWERAFTKAERVRDGVRSLLGDPTAEVALGANTHDLLVKLLSAIDLPRRPRIVTTDGEFHSLRRQLARLAEVGVDVVAVPARPVDAVAERVVAATTADTAAVMVSAVLFEDARIVPGLDAVAAACRERGVELVVDAYHAVGAMPFTLAAEGLEDAFVVGAGYKYLQWGEGNAYLRLPPHAHHLCPVVTGWFAEFADLSGPTGTRAVPYPRGGDAFATATYDVTSNYRAARVLDFFVEQQLTPERLRASYRRQVELLAGLVDALELPDDVLTRDRETPLDRFGAFLAVHSPYAGELRVELARRGVSTDSRGDTLRLGPAPYLSDAQIEAAISELGVVVGAIRGSTTPSSRGTGA